MLSEKLKELTKTNHQLLEKKIVTQLKLIKDINDYAVMIGIFYSFFGGLELQIIKHIDQEKLTDYDSRRKTVILANDLINLTGVIQPLADMEDLPIIENHLQAMGALYVIEGSSLGGQIISKMIVKQLDVQEPVSMSYFNGYVDQTNLMWQRFKQNLDEPFYHTHEDIIIEAANNTFLKFSHWFDASY